MRVLVFGDSITQGYWAVEYGWVDRIRKHYDALQVQDLEGRDEPSIFNLGISADTSSEILSRIGTEVSARTRPNHPVNPVVVIQTGINDSRREPYEFKVPLPQYKANLRAIIDQMKQVASKTIFIGFSACDEARTTPVFWGQYYYRNSDIKQYEEAMAEVAKERKVPFIPVFDEFKAALDRGEDLLSDGLHPNDAGHELIYQTVKPKLEELLK